MQISVFLVVSESTGNKAEAAISELLAPCRYSSCGSS
jgi:hypothetical protein